uniref:NADH-ubiquinone oxidoreductase chain 4 n=1 Tax=Ophioglossum californicum TaxID=1267209 RepID=A0A1B3TRH3_9MONI|nr:NADH dehydrogenase subunit 4 [Ophioglossum californicum]YP_010439851.1 NADH dehydrogenase subunit 4 [Ophioglossum vulgatum]AOH05903.1 NADH dehydrogenase subunit 4 [Ophioglossum californicum]UTD44897.1 NADH dehydrogenase subunit 4 [Ophioglossum vulgatum]
MTSQSVAFLPTNLSGLILCPLLGSIILLVIPDSRIRLIRSLGLCASLITSSYPPVSRIQFDNPTAKSQSVETRGWLPYSNIDLVIGIDGLPSFSVVSTTFLIPICILVGWSSIKSYKKEYIIAFPIGESFMIAVSRTPDTLLPYVFSESVLIPTFIIIGVWGSGQRKTQAAYQSFPYTPLGFVFMLLAILLISSQTGTTDSHISLTTESSERRQILLRLALFASSSVKVPMVPVHIWLPEAHVEAPTAGFVTSAGTPSKLGTHGFSRFSIPMFPEATPYSTPFIYTPSVIAIIYTSLTTMRQIDPKKIIAHPPVAHMNFVTTGMFSPNVQGIEGSVLPMSSHGPVSSAPSSCVGAPYDRHKTRLVKYYGGLVSTMPNPSTIPLFFTSANMSLPGTSSFIGEFPILVGASQRNSLAATLAALGMILGAAYSLWLYNRVVFGNSKTKSLHKFSDSNRREVLIFLPFIFGIIRMGVYPSVSPECMHTSVSNSVQHGKFGGSA